MAACLFRSDGLGSCHLHCFFRVSAQKYYQNPIECQSKMQAPAMKSITQLAHEKGYKVGILTSVSLDHATPAANILNVPFVAAKVLNILVGSFGLVTVAPFTALVAGLLYRVSDKK